MATSLTNKFSKRIIVFLGGSLGGMVQCATGNPLLTNTPLPDDLDFALKSIIGGFITLGIKLVGDWLIHLYKKFKDRNNGPID